MDMTLDESDNQSMRAMANLLDLSHEMLHNIFVYVDPADLASLSQTCSALDCFIKGNTLLCKELYLRYWVR